MRGCGTTVRSDGLMHRCRIWILLVLGLAITQVALSSSARAQQTDVTFERFGSFFHFKRTPKVLFLLDEIISGDSFELRRAIRQNNIQLIVTSSPGGAVFEALQISGIVFDNNISTYVPKDGSCESACSFIFFAGENRIISGELGVHQFFTADALSSEDIPTADTMFTAQFTTSEIIGFLNQYGTPPFVYERMFSTSEMHYFNQESLTIISRGLDSPIMEVMIPAAEAQLEILRRNIATRDRESNENATTSDTAEGGSVAPAPTDLAAEIPSGELAIQERPDFDFAKEALERRDYRASINLFGVFIQSYPGSALTHEAYFLQGQAFYQLGEHGNAARAYLESFTAAQEGPVAPAALMWLGRSLHTLGNHLDGCLTLDEVGARFPSTAEAAQSATWALGFGCD